MITLLAHIRTRYIRTQESFLVREVLGMAAISLHHMTGFQSVNGVSHDLLVPPVFVIEV